MKHKVLIFSSDKKIELNDIANCPPSKQTNKYKPYGLWYALGLYWFDFLYDVEDKYFYFIKLFYTTWDKPDPSKVLTLDTINAFDNFTFKYGYVNTYENVCINVAFSLLCKEKFGSLCDPNVH